MRALLPRRQLRGFGQAALSIVERVERFCFQRQRGRYMEDVERPSGESSGPALSKPPRLRVDLIGHWFDYEDTRVNVVAERCVSGVGLVCEQFTTEQTKLQRIGEFEFSEWCEDHRLDYPSHPGSSLRGVGVKSIEGNEEAGVSVSAQ